MSGAPYAGPTCDLTPDADTIWKFVTWWFHHCMVGRIEVGWMDGKWGGLTHFRQFEIDDEELIAAVVAANSIPGQSVYVRASTVARRDVFSKEAGYTTDADFVQSPGTWGDLDTLEQVERARTVQSIIRPNGSVITGRIPHMRVQPYFRTDEPIKDADLVRSLNRRVLALYQGDPAVVNPTRLMRLPGTIAWPWKAGRVPELTTFALPNDNRIASYPVDMLLAQLPHETSAEREQPKQDEPKGTNGLNRVSDLIRAIQAGQEWHNNMLRLTAHWIGRGWSDTEILTACEAMTLKGYTVEETRADAAKMVKTGRDRWGVPDEEATVGDGPAAPFKGGVVDPWDTLAPPEFPIHVLPRVLREFVETRARVMGADPCALAWCCLSACSAAIPGSVRLQVKRHEQWTVPPSLWVALIGASSAKKSPIISAAWHPLEHAQSADLREYGAAVKRWKAMPKKERDAEPEPIPPRRLVTHDATMESLQELLSHQNRGIGVLRDELSGFIAGMDKYTSGKGGSERAFFLQSYNGGPYVSDRIGRGTTAVDNLLVTVCGGIQPDRLAQFSDLADDGLWQRFVPIIVAKMGMDTDEPTGPEAEAYAGVIDRLMTTPATTRAAFSEGAHAVRERVARELFELEQATPLSGHFTSFVGKLLGMFARLALVLSQIEPAGIASFIVTAEHAEAARVLIMRCVLPHAEGVYMTMGAGQAKLADTQAVASYIVAKQVQKLFASDLGRKVRASYRNMTVGEVQKLLSPLVAGGWLAPEADTPGNKCWLVNPAVHTTFASRAAEEARRRAFVNEVLHGEEEEVDG